MVRVAVQPSSWLRAAMMFAVAVGLVLPAPARCASCSAGSSTCAMCQAAADDVTKSVAGTCCQGDHDKDAVADIASRLTDCIKVQAGKCGCRFSPVERANVSADRQWTVSEIWAAMPATLPLVDDAASSAISPITACGDLPPPVPHRVLHCSWII